MPFNLLKKYPELLELGMYDSKERKKSLLAIFKRDIEDRNDFLFRGKTIRPIKKDGEAPMQTLFNHLTTRIDKDIKGNLLGTRSFEMTRSVRLHWIKTHIEELQNEGVEVFSFKDRNRVNRKDVVRTYIFNTNQDYVIILEPQRSRTDYYLLTAYYLNEPGGKNQILKKMKRKLKEVY